MGQVPVCFHEVRCVALRPEITVTISMTIYVTVVNQYPQVAV